jgi:hypothetical protein
MNVKIGWSAEVKPGEWAKHDVELDDGDFDSWCYEHDINPDQFFRPSVKFKILENLASRMVYAHVGSRHEIYRSQAQEHLKSLAQAEAVMVASLKATQVA